MHHRASGHPSRRQTPPGAPSTINHRGVLADAAFHLAETRREAELQLVAAVLADHARLVRVAADAGLRRHHFSCEDLALIYHAACRRRRRERRYVLRRAMLALMAGGYWDTSQVKSNLGQCLWSAESLIALGSSWFPSHAVVAHFAKRVIGLADRHQGATTHYNHMVMALTGCDAGEGSIMQIRRAA